MSHDVFISHSARDKPYADRVCMKLESRGIRCWVAPRDIRPGMNWGSAIVEAIDGARVMLLLFSSHANGSPQVSREVERAVNKGLVVVPVRVEDVKPSGDLEYFLGTPHWLEAITPPFERHLDHIADSVRFWIDRNDSNSELSEKTSSAEPVRNDTPVISPISETARPNLSSPAGPNEETQSIQAAATPIGASRINLVLGWLLAILILGPACFFIYTGVFRDNTAEMRFRGDQSDRAGKYAEALRFYRAAAAEGDANAEAKIGWMYVRGEGVGEDYKQAADWLRKAADAREADGEVGIGILSINGLGVPKNYGGAMASFKKAAEQGDTRGEDGIGFLYENGLGVTQNYGEAVRWYRKAAESGDQEAQSDLGNMYQCGQGVAQDYKQALYWYRKAAELQYPTAEQRIGYMYESGFGVKKDYLEALDWYRRAAAPNDSFQRALRVMRIMAGSGGAQAQDSLGQASQYGTGMPRDNEQALQWYLKAAAQTYHPAELHLGYVYQLGVGASQDYGVALGWYRKASDAGDARAAHSIATMYDNGWGVPRDHAAAVDWYRVAATRGDTVAQTRLVALQKQ
jgi:TPR repeat protein